MITLAYHNKNKRSGGPQSGYIRTPLPNKRKREMFGIADQLLGGGRIKVVCADGKTRLCRIPGKMKKRKWIHEGDLLILRPWDFQDEKADIVSRYTKIQAINISKRGLIPSIIDVF